MDRNDLTQEMLRQQLRYDPETGVFTWNVEQRSGAKKGGVAGKQNPEGYLYISAFGLPFFAHRLAWLHVYGSWPQQQIDHIDGNTSNNKLSNLRDVSPRTNQQNRYVAQKTSRTGLIGVSKTAYEKWYARIRVDGKHKFLGCFSTPELASSAYLEAKRIYHNQGV